ncbi:MAG TPA: glycoside hydrolase family 3 protein [Vicinamibacterales bacterium]|nr:glycoside hydrolase family 3 protein [Vicinamibacterales bacterium]
MKPAWTLATVCVFHIAVAQGPATVLDRAAARWVEDTFKRMTIEDKVGQIVAPGVDSTYLATDSETFDRLRVQVRDLKVGGFVLFGGSEPAPRVLPDYRYGTVVLGEPLAAASVLNRLQGEAAIPLLVSSDFESGVAFRIAGGTRFPRQMAVAAAGDEALATEAARITAVEGRALGVHVNFSPVADVNNNARNPVINTRAFGEDPQQVGRLASAYIRGYQAGGMLAVLKHFPGHGDTDVDSHVGLPVITHPRDRLDAVELWPFRYGMSEGADGVMTAHIVLPALDAAEFSPASLSRPIVTDLLRGELGFGGLIFTDAVDMDAIEARLDPGTAAVRAVLAGNDVVTKPRDAAAAVAGIRAAVERGEIDIAIIDTAVRRLLVAKARLGLHRTRTVSLDDVAATVGGRRHQAVAQELGQKAITLLRDERNQVPLRVPRDASVLYLSILDYPSGWRIGVPSRTFLPELRARWPNVTAIELSDRSSPGEIDLVRATALRYDAIVASVFVRTASGSGAQDLPAPLARLLDDLARRTTGTTRPFLTVFFGNPYAPMSVPSLPAMLLTYDVYDLAELTAVRALAGEATIGGRLPITLPGLFERGHGIVR